jgi:hypothetical protein
MKVISLPDYWDTGTNEQAFAVAPSTTCCSLNCASHSLFQRHLMLASSMLSLFLDSSLTNKQLRQMKVRDLLPIRKRHYLATAQELPPEATKCEH